jgi:hypothetical protein
LPTKSGTNFPQPASHWTDATIVALEGPAMNPTFDCHHINHMITAIGQEMHLRARELHTKGDALFIGGLMPDDADQAELAQFGLRKNWKIIYAAFHPADVLRGPIAFHVVVTDGLTETMVLQDGRLWKKDARCPAILVFAHLGLTVRVGSKGRLLARALTRPCHDHGYDLAIQSVMARAAREPGHIPVISTIGRLPTVLDIRTMNHAFANAE